MYPNLTPQMLAVMFPAAGYGCGIGGTQTAECASAVSVPECLPTTVLIESATGSIGGHVLKLNVPLAREKMV